MTDIAGIELRPSGGVGAMSLEAWAALVSGARPPMAAARIDPGFDQMLRRLQGPGAPSGMATSGLPPALDSRAQALLAGIGRHPNLGREVVAGAVEHLGTPYLWGGNDANQGVDCSGLVRDAFRDIGVDMPRVSRDQARMGVAVDGLENALPGDLLAFGNPVNHVAIYVGNGQMVHAPRRGEVVKIEDIDRPIATIRRIVDTRATPEAGWSSLAGGATFGPPELQPLFEAAGNRWGIDPALLAAVAKVESNFDLDAVSRSGAQGLMQFMPATAAALGVNPADPASAIDGAARYLRENLDRFGTIDLALAAYNAGPGAVARHGGIPPFEETQRYVPKVREQWRIYAA